MNIPALIVACVLFFAFLAHLFGGTRETAAIAPSGGDAKLSAHWVQAMCAFQMLGVDLLLVSGALFAIVFWDLGAIENTLQLIISGLLLLWGVTWIIQIIWLRGSGVTLLRLPHWMVWFFCSALLFFTA